MLLQRLSSQKVLVDLGPNQLFGLVVLLIWMIGIGRFEDEAGKAKKTSRRRFGPVLGDKWGEA